MPAWLPCLSTLRRLFTTQYLSFDNDGVFTGNPNRGKVSRNQTQLLAAAPCACTQAQAMPSTSASGSHAPLRPACRSRLSRC